MKQSTLENFEDSLGICWDWPVTSKLISAISQRETLGYSMLSILSYYLIVSCFKRKIFVLTVFCINFIEIHDYIHILRT
jgi:hypothetical protein